MKDLKGISHKKHGIFFGVGVMDYDGLVWKDGKNLDSYVAWMNMLHRCYDEKYLSKYPTYENCRICDEWLYFSNFKLWYDENYIKGYQLDKDLFQKGAKEKIYSPQTCCFLPSEINSLLCAEKPNKALLPSGIFKYGKNNYGVRIMLGSEMFKKNKFRNVYDALKCVKDKKFEYAKRISFKLYNDGKISFSIYTSIINYFKV